MRKQRRMSRQFFWKLGPGKERRKGAMAPFRVSAVFNNKKPGVCLNADWEGSHRTREVGNPKEIG